MPQEFMRLMRTILDATQVRQVPKKRNSVIGRYIRSGYGDVVYLGDEHDTEIADLEIGKYDYSKFGYCIYG